MFPSVRKMYQTESGFWPLHGRRGGGLGRACVLGCLFIFFSFKHDDIPKRVFCELTVWLTILEVLCRTRKGHVIICGVRHLIARTKSKSQVLSLGLTLLLLTILHLSGCGVGTGLCSIKCLCCRALFEVKSENLQWQAWVLFDLPWKRHRSKDNGKIWKWSFSLFECFPAALKTQPQQHCAGIGEPKNLVEWSSSLS